MKESFREQAELIPQEDWVRSTIDLETVYATGKFKLIRFYQVSNADDGGVFGPYYKFKVQGKEVVSGYGWSFFFNWARRLFKRLEKNRA